MSIKLIALDIDETLLTTKHEIAESTKVALKKAHEQGIKVVLCTGRPLAGVSMYLNELGLSGSDQYVVTYNGALVQNLDGEIIARNILTNAEYQQIDRFAEHYHVQYNILDEDSKIYTPNDDISWFTVIQAMENEAGIHVRQANQFSDDFEIAKAVLVGDTKLLDYAESDPDHILDKDHFYVVRSTDNFLEVMNKEANKGAGLQELAEYLKLKPDELMAFGDERNDLPMFEYVGTSVGMGNGSDYIKGQVSFVTKSNDDDGIAFALNKFLK